MTALHLRPAAEPLPRPAYAWLAVVLEIFTAIPALIVGWQLVTDTSGATVGFPQGWIEATVFGSYLVPGLYLLVFNGLGMLVLAALTATRHWVAPWLTILLGAGLVIWILVQLVVMPEFSFLQAIYGLTGVVLVILGTAWVHATGQLLPR